MNRNKYGSLICLHTTYITLSGQHTVVPGENLPPYSPTIRYFRVENAIYGHQCIILQPCA